MLYIDAYNYWTENFRPEVEKQYGEDDTVALSESWNDFTNSLNADGEFTDLQYSACPAYDDDIPEDAQEELSYLLKHLGLTDDQGDDLNVAFDNL